MYTDTIIASMPSWHRRNKYAQIFATSFGWTRTYPIMTKGDAHNAFSAMAHEVGVPTLLIMDGSKEQTLGEFKRKCSQANVTIHQTEPESPWQNLCESQIRELKRGYGRSMVKRRVPHKLWDHCLEYESTKRNRTATKAFELQGQTPESVVTGQPTDISDIAEHEFYEFVMFWDNHPHLPETKETLGRWLGPAPNVGSAMTAKILKENGQVIPVSTYRPMTPEEKDRNEVLNEMNHFDETIKQKLGTPLTVETIRKDDPDMLTPDIEAYEDDSEGTIPLNQNDEVTPEEYDQYINAQVNFPHDDQVRTGTVKRRVRGPDGELRGLANNNPILDTRLYEVEFPDGRTKEYTANTIAENMYAMCDPQGNQYQLLEAITDHIYETSETEEDRYFEHRGQKHPKMTTKGWKLLVEWKDGTATWAPLADIKESYPIQAAEYATVNDLQDEPGFSYWVKETLKRRDRNVKKVKTRQRKAKFKFGFEVPDTVQRAHEIDKENGNTYWADAIGKEMETVKIAFEILEDGKDPPPGYKYMQGHLIFDIKMENFQRKARYVAGGHLLNTPDTMTYASVVSRETIRIALTIAALNDLEVKTSDIKGAYLTAPCTEKVWTILGPEFGEHAGKKALVVRALYGLKSAGQSYTRHMADCMRHLGWTSCLADPDLWMKPMTRPDDGFEYYSYVLLWVDDVLAIHHDAEKVIRELDHYFPMKKGSIGDPDLYLGAKLRKTTMTNGVEAWGLSPSKYVQEVVRTTEKRMKDKGHLFPKKIYGPWPSNYNAELDTSEELDYTMANDYQCMIGILHWIVELGRVDIITEVSTLASYLAAPRMGHLEAAIHVYRYLKTKHNGRLVFDPTYPRHDKGDFQSHDWKHFYGDVSEAIPPNAPKPRGKEVDLTMYVDSDHAGDKRNRRSRTGFFILLNCALIAWLSKKQATVETAVFGAEFVAMKHGMERLRAIRYKLRMMGVEITGPSKVYGDNMSVIKNTQKPESTLKKKSLSVCFHFCRESVAMGESLTAHVDSVENPADLATKIITQRAKREYLVSKLMHDVYDEHD